MKQAGVAARLFKFVYCEARSFALVPVTFNHLKIVFSSLPGCHRVDVEHRPGIDDERAKVEHYTTTQVVP